jgi:hypothetical protein
MPKHAIEVLKVRQARFKRNSVHVSITVDGRGYSMNVSPKYARMALKSHRRTIAEAKRRLAWNSVKAFWFDNQEAREKVKILRKEIVWFQDRIAFFKWALDGDNFFNAIVNYISR